MIELNFDIDKITEQIKPLSYKKKIEFLTDKEEEFYALIDILDGYAEEISSLKDEIEEQQISFLHKEIEEALASAGCNLKFKNGQLTIVMRGTIITIYVRHNCICLQLNSETRQRSYQNLVATLLPNFKHDDINSFSLDCPYEKICHTVVDTIVTISKAKFQFDEILG